MVDVFAGDGRSRGFIDGQTITYERYLTPLSTAAANVQLIVGSAPDLIFWNQAASVAAVAVTMNKTIPLVVTGADLVGEGIVGNLAHPGVNVTCVAGSAGPSEEGKVLGLLAEAQLIRNSGQKRRAATWTAQQTQSAKI